MIIRTLMGAWVGKKTITEYAGLLQVWYEDQVFMWKEELKKCGDLIYGTG